MKLGIIARCDQRGIAYQTTEFWENMGRPRALVVTMDEPAWPEEPGRFGDNAVTVSSNLSRNLNERGLDERRVRRFLDGLDVVFAVETVYDWRLLDWARDMRVKVVIQGNPEFYAHGSNPGWAHPDQWWWPTTWMLDRLPEGEVVPVPAPESPVEAGDPDDDTLRILHVIGKQAAGDRNGSLEFLESVAGYRGDIHVRVVTQGDRLPRTNLFERANVELEVITGGVDDRWSMYEGMHALVLPRKYGGLCLDRSSRVTLASGRRRRIDELQIGDCVVDPLRAADSPVTANPITGRSSRRVDQHVVVSVRGRLIKSSLDHRHLVSDSPDPRGLIEKTARDVQPGQWCFVAQPPGDGVKVVDVGPKPVVKALKFWPRNVRLDEGWARLIGLWLAEGHRGRYPRKGRQRPESLVAWSIGERDEYLADEIVQLLGERGIKATKRLVEQHDASFGPGRIFHVRTRNVWLNEFLDALGVEAGSHHKRAPDLPDHLVPALIGGWLDGDGSSDGRSIRGFSRSVEMIGDLWRLALKVGVLGGIGHDGQSLTFSGPCVDAVANWCHRHQVEAAKKAATSTTSVQVDGGWMVKIRSVKLVDEPLDVIAIETESGRYVAEDILTHNCLPALEAMSTGLTVVMPDCSPNETWPGPRTAARKGRIQRSPFGKIQTYGTHPNDLSSIVNRLARDREMLADEMEQAARWADWNRWDDLRPKIYEPLLEALT